MKQSPEATEKTLFDLIDQQSNRSSKSLLKVWGICTDRHMFHSHFEEKLWRLLCSWCWSNKKWNIWHDELFICAVSLLENWVRVRGGVGGHWGRRGDRVVGTGWMGVAQDVRDQRFFFKIWRSLLWLFLDVLHLILQILSSLHQPSTAVCSHFLLLLKGLLDGCIDSNREDFHPATGVSLSRSSCLCFSAASTLEVASARPKDRTCSPPAGTSYFPGPSPLGPVQHSQQRFPLFVGPSSRCCI